MVNQYDTLLKMQMAFWENWFKMVSDGCCGMEKLWAHQLKLFEHGPYVRLHDYIPNGASWFDHYGHRSHDVDVDKV